MTEQNPFDRQQIEASVAPPATGILEQLNLPPALIAFLRQHRRQVRIVAACFVALIVAVALYGTYSDYRANKAASALTAALRESADKKQQALAQVVADYGSTSSALWAGIEIASLLESEKKPLEAIDHLRTIEEKVSLKNPLKPLLLSKLAVLSENNDKTTEALTYYTQLTGFKAFEADACKGMGRIHEASGKKEEAIKMYEKYLALTEFEKDEMSTNAQAKELVESRLAILRKK